MIRPQKMCLNWNKIVSLLSSVRIKINKKVRESDTAVSLAEALEASDVEVDRHIHINNAIKTVVSRASTTVNDIVPPESLNHRYVLIYFRFYLFLNLCMLLII